jgi:hypothetical protein
MLESFPYLAFIRDSLHVPERGKPRQYVAALNKGV